MIAGNWNFTLNPALPGTPSVTMAGNINSSGSSVTGAVHVSSESCFDWKTTAVLTGTLNGDDVSLAATAIDGQVITLTGSFATKPAGSYYITFTGKFTINGGCAAGEQGSVSGSIVPYIDNPVNGSFQSSRGSFNLAGDIAQRANASSDGSFGIAGTVTFDTPCFSQGITNTNSGTFPSGSFILGTTVTLEIETGNGVLTFLGNISQDGSEISGNYTVSGGSCPDMGTAVLHLLNPWDY